MFLKINISENLNLISVNKLLYYYVKVQSCKRKLFRNNFGRVLIEENTLSRFCARISEKPNVELNSSFLKTMYRLCIVIILNYKISGYFHYIFDFEKNRLRRLVSELLPTSYYRF